MLKFQDVSDDSELLFILNLHFFLGVNPKKPEHEDPVTPAAMAASTAALLAALFG